ncbi:hypothetical protein BTS2_1087 [Bacillus sp. TS-2]|nr:hypothetical protein BTS2_1087 [Bacillus sp. TS-2]
MLKLHHIGIEVKDLKKSLAYYETYFQAKYVNQFKIGKESIIFIQLGELTIELVHSSQKKNKKTSSTIHIALQVENVIDWYESLLKKNLPPSEGPYQLSNGWKVVYYQGPNQELIELIQ